MTRTRRIRMGEALGSILVLFLLGGGASAQLPGTVLTEQKVSSTAGGLLGPLADSDAFGRGLALVGDLDGDCIPDLAVGADQDDDGGASQGAVHLLFLANDGTVQAEQKISESAGGFGGALDPFDQFGVSVAGPGDLDGDGTVDLVVGASQDDDGGTNRGAVWVLLLNRDGTVGAETKISSTSGGFGGSLADGDRFGASVCALGDLDGDGVADLAVGADQDDDGGPNRGAVWILLLNANGSVKAERKISQTSGGLSRGLANDDRFGFSVANLGDLDGDGRAELAVGADQDDDGGSSTGAAYVLFLKADGTVKRSAKVSALSGLSLTGFDRFGSSVAGPGDVDGDGVRDLAVGAINDDDGGINRGAVWIVYLDAQGAVLAWSKISATTGGFGGTLDVNDAFGIALAPVGDLDRDGSEDLVVGAMGDDDGGRDRGAGWVLSLQTAPAAGVTLRNGSGINAMRLTGTVAPSLGQAWSATVDCSGHGSGLAFHLGVRSARTGPVVAAGELLVDPASALLFVQAVPHLGGQATFNYFVPFDLSLCGILGYSQAICGGAPAAELTNALDFVVGR